MPSSENLRRWIERSKTPNLRGPGIGGAYTQSGCICSDPALRRWILSLAKKRTEQKHNHTISSPVKFFFSTSRQFQPNHSPCSLDC